MYTSVPRNIKRIENATKGNPLGIGMRDQATTTLRIKEETGTFVFTKSSMREFSIIIPL